MTDKESEPTSSPSYKNSGITTSSCSTGELNLFSHNSLWSSKLTSTEQLLATRLFLILLFISFLAVIIWASLIIQTHDVTLKEFSLADFERLEALHSGTINAPCTHVSIPHEKFIQLTPQFHQICSSSFIGSEWISSLFLSNATSHNILDFRTFGFAQFRALALLCQTARQAVNDAYHTYTTTRLTTSHALTRTQFNQMIVALINNFKRNVVVNEKRTSRVVSMNIAYNRLISALRTNYYIQSVPGSRRYKTYNGVYTKENETVAFVCDCRLEGHQCFYQAGSFYNWTIPQLGKPAKSIPPPRFQIPGLMAGCLPLESIRQSTLECLYNQSCVNSLILQPKLSSPKALNISLSRFPLTKTIGSMFDESLFVESWFNTSNFSQYFATCAPQSLSYSYKGRFHLVFMFTICIGAFGGLFIIWEVITPVLVKYWSRIKSKRQQNQSATQSKQTDIERNTQNTDSVAQHHQTEHKFNLFSSDNENNNKEDRVETIHTRLYISFLLIGLLIVALYFSFVKPTQTFTILFPTLEEFKQLKSLHSSNLICPCSRLSTPYAQITSVSPQYHQVCSSEFLQKLWLSYFGRVELNIEDVNFITPDFRVSGQSFFDFIRSFCQTAQDTVENALHVFNSTRLITVDALSPEQFNNQTTQLLKTFQQQTIASFLNLISLVRSSIQNNQLISEMWTNVGPRSVFNSETSNWSIRFAPRNFFTNSCSCGLSNQCSRPVGFYLQSDKIHSSPNTTVPGLVIGCFPIDSVLLSTLECFYDQQCIKLIVDMYDFDVVDMVQPLDHRVANIQPLHKEQNSRFPPNTTLESIFSQLFIEDWMQNSNFTAYYTHCAPKQCSHSIRQRHNILFILVILLGFYGGLSAILEVILPYIVKKVRRRTVKRQDEQENSTSNNLASSKKVSA
ncbi:unnamed protein product [Rotaria sp. Silwood1]|nr:unnamed protein product [Rotaria sp. Silwood1]CAF1157831.1 unnamed protein product [Rotaria sp. Silwood1]